MDHISSSNSFNSPCSYILSNLSVILKCYIQTLSTIQLSDYTVNWTSAYSTIPMINFTRNYTHYTLNVSSINNNEKVVELCFILYSENVWQIDVKVFKTGSKIKTIIRCRDGKKERNNFISSIYYEAVKKENITWNIIKGRSLLSVKYDELLMGNTSEENCLVPVQSIVFSLLDKKSHSFCIKETNSSKIKSRFRYNTSLPYTLP